MNRTNDKNNNLGKRYAPKILGLFFTLGISLKTWYKMGMLEREVAIYNRLSDYFDQIYFFSYGDYEDTLFENYLEKNIRIIPKKYIKNNFLYSVLAPVIHSRILKNIAILKTNQMWGSWSAVIAKLLHKNILVTRVGYMLSVFYKKKHPKQSVMGFIINRIERIAYKFADGIIVPTYTDLKYVISKYKPLGKYAIIPNYVETDVHKPRSFKKMSGSICFVGRLSEQKNLFALLEALKGLPYTLTVIGSGELENELKKFASKNKIKVRFKGNIPNHELPYILNEHEVFILPSFYEGLPKALLEAMSCGLAVIATNVEGNNEVITNGKNGILCETDPNSIRRSIIKLMENKKLQKKLGKRARETVLRKYSLEVVVKKEIELYKKIYRE